MAAPQTRHTTSVPGSTSSSGGTADLVKILFAIFLPPVGVFLEVGIGKHFWLNIVLTLLGFIPGLVHAVWVIATR
ncbi:MAG: YqaE/Pmp3 family membrane protein [Bdellovibrionales bacterium]|nr:YqaE/Pmp3 family membrane protein [Bdellovibrionales bacterium]